MRSGRGGRRRAPRWSAARAGGRSTKLAPSRPATAPGPGPPRAHGVGANTMHPGLGRGSCGARPWDFLVNRSPTPGPHPHPLPPGSGRGLSRTTLPAPPASTFLSNRAEEGAGRWGPREIGGRGLGGKGEQGARWGVGRRTATQRNSLSLAGETNLLSPGPRVLSRPTSGSAGPLRSAAPAPSHAPLTRHLSPGLRFVCAFFFPFLSRPAPAASSPLPRPPPPFPGRITFPGLRSGSPGCLQRPVCGRAIAKPPEPARSSAGGRRGEGRGRARTFDPGGPRRRSRAWEGDTGARCERDAGSLRGEVERTGAASIWGENERGGEERQRGRGERRERERCSDRDCHWGQRSTAPGSWAALAPLAVSSPPGPRALHAPAVVPAHSNPPPAPRGRGVSRRGGRAEGEARRLLVLPGSSRRQEAELQVHHRV